MLTVVQLDLRFFGIKTSVVSIMHLVEACESLNTVGMLLSTTILDNHMFKSLNL